MAKKEFKFQSFVVTPLPHLLIFYEILFILFMKGSANYA